MSVVIVLDGVCSRCGRLGFAGVPFDPPLAICRKCCDAIAGALICAELNTGNPDDSHAEPCVDGWLVVAKAYQSRWETETGDCWMAFDRNRRDLEGVGMYCKAKAAKTGKSIESVAAEVLDAFFADPFATKTKWPIGVLAKNPGGYVAAKPTEPVDGRGLTPSQQELNRKILAGEM